MEPTEEDAVGALVAVAVAVLALEGPTMPPSSISGKSKEKDSWMRQLGSQ